MRKPVRRGLFALLIVCGVCLLTWRFLPRERLLLEHARRVTDTTQWGAGSRRFNESIGSHWLSDQEILFDLYEGVQHNQRVIYKRNIETGQETKLDGLTASRNHLSEEIVDDQCVSPDGKWFLCSARWSDCLLAEVNGTRHYLYSRYSSANYDHSRSLYWLPDSRHWMEQVGSLESYGPRKCTLLLHDTQNPRLGIKLPVNMTTVPPGLENLLALDKAVVVTWPDEENNEAGEPIVKPDATRTKQVTISYIPWRTGGKPFACYSIAVPFGLKNYEIKISPDAKHVVWQVTAQKQAPVQEWLHRYLPFVKTVQYKTTVVWVCNIDGSDRHELGRVLEAASDPEENDTGTDSLLEELKWLPGGKHLSFEYEDTLYVVPIEAENKNRS